MITNLICFITGGLIYFGIKWLFKSRSKDKYIIARGCRKIL